MIRYTPLAEIASMVTDILVSVPRATTVAIDLTQTAMTVKPVNDIVSKLAEAL